MEVEVRIWGWEVEILGQKNQNYLIKCLNVRSKCWNFEIHKSRSWDKVKVLKWNVKKMR